jgi:YD repeat-containing protein
MPIGLYPGVPLVFEVGKGRLYYDNRPTKVVTEDGTLTEFAYDFAGDRVSQKVYAPGETTPHVSTYIGTIMRKRAPSGLNTSTGLGR